MFKDFGPAWQGSGYFFPCGKDNKGNPIECGKCLDWDKSLVCSRTKGDTCLSSGDCGMSNGKRLQCGKMVKGRFKDVKDANSGVEAGGSYMSYYEYVGGRVGTCIVPPDSSAAACTPGTVRKGEAAITTTTITTTTTSSSGTPGTGSVNVQHGACSLSSHTTFIQTK